MKTLKSGALILKQFLTNVYVILSVLWAVFVLHAPIQERNDAIQQRAAVITAVHEICVNAFDWFGPETAAHLSTPCERRVDELMRGLSDLRPRPSLAEWAGWTFFAVMPPLFVYCVIWVGVTGTMSGVRRIIGSQ
jgi:hypothetical protein